MERRRSSLEPVLGHAEQPAQINSFFSEDRCLLEGLGNKIYYVQHKSFTQMLTQDYQSGREHFGHINPYEHLRSFKPVATQVAINPTQLYIPDSNLLTFDDRVALIERINFSLKEEGITGFKAIMPDASTLAQLDRIHQEETGEKLIVGLYACATTETAGSQFSAVGRINSRGKLSVVSCSRNQDSRNVFVVPVFVPILQ